MMMTTRIFLLLALSGIFSFSFAQKDQAEFLECTQDDAVTICGMRMSMILEYKGSDPGHLSSCNFYVANRTAKPQQITLENLFETNGVRRDEVPGFHISSLAGQSSHNGNVLTVLPDATAQFTISWDKPIAIYPSCRGSFALELQAKHGATPLNPNAVLDLELEFPEMK